MDLSEIMKMAGQLRQQLSEAQAEAQKLRVSGEAGGGLVRLVMNGRHEVVELHLDPSAVPGLGGDDLALLEDLLRAAVNQASARVADELQQRLGGMAQGLGIDPSVFGLGGGGSTP